MRSLTIETAESVIEEYGVDLRYHVGTMIELPRAALLADKVAVHADFFSFGTNDLTQMTYGLSRDDMGKFFPDYQRAGLMPTSPLSVFDVDSVGQLVEIGTTRGRQGNRASRWACAASTVVIRSAWASSTVSVWTTSAARPSVFPWLVSRRPMRLWGCCTEPPSFAAWRSTVPPATTRSSMVNQPTRWARYSRTVASVWCTAVAASDSWARSPMVRSRAAVR